MKLTKAKLQVLLERAEVKPKPEDFEVVLRLMGPYFDRLSKFRELDLSGEEVAGTYTPPR
jgi:hypothetical protein